MRAIDAKEFRLKRHKIRRRLMGHRWLAVMLVLIIIAGLIYAVQAYRRPLPVLVPKIKTIQTTTAQTVQLTWPAYGQSAIGAVGYGLLATNNTQQSVPMASVAKVVTALAVLRKHPLAEGQQGPILTLTSNDVTLYDSYAAQDGSVVPVNDGEQLSEYQALEAMLLPSANNMADTLAIWAFGSMDNYLNYANNMVVGLKLNQTHMADASGFSAQTVSSASDLIVLGMTALSSPVLSQIVSQSQADIPVAGTVKNVNYLLGQNGIVGIKTGNTSQAGGCYLFAARRNYGSNQNVTVVGAVMGAQDLVTAMTSAVPLLSSTYQNFGRIPILKANQYVGNYSAPWGGEITAITRQDISIFGWKGDIPKTNINLYDLNYTQDPSQKIGQVTIRTSNGTKMFPLFLSTKIPVPSLYWRILRPAN